MKRSDCSGNDEVKKLKRVLCIVGAMNVGGAETFLMKLYRNMDRSKYQMDFCVFDPKKGSYDDEITQMGGRIFHCVSKSSNPIKSFLELKKIVKENEFELVLRISQHSLSAMELLAAKLGGAKKTIFRSSNSSTCGSAVNQLMHKLCKPLAKYVPEVKIAPSTEAAEFMFGKKSVKKGKVVFLRNGLAVSDFTFDEENRSNLRKELNLEDKFIIGHVGRFQRQKNHKFLIDVFEEILKQKESAHLVLVGDTGELLEETKSYVTELGLESKVTFIGNRSDVNRLLSAFDMLVFPSLYEGMPNVVIEAQAAGLPCLIADTITPEADITGLVTYMSLTESAEKWAEKCLEIKDKETTRKNTKENFIKAKYDINSVTDEFIKLVFS